MVPKTKPTFFFFSKNYFSGTTLSTQFCINQSSNRGQTSEGGGERGERGGPAVGRLWRTSGGEARDTREGVVLRKVRVPGPNRSHQDILVKYVGPHKVPRKGAGSEWRPEGPRGRC